MRKRRRARQHTRFPASSEAHCMRVAANAAVRPELTVPSGGGQQQQVSTTEASRLRC
jgi:hypothetical protein